MDNKVEKIYRVAIDVAEGSLIPGKRTPALPRAVDKEELGIRVKFEKGATVPEHYGNTGVAHFLKAALERCGIEPVMINYSGIETWYEDEGFNTDVNKDVIARQFAIADAECDIAVSLHHNAIGNGTWNGTTGVYMIYNGKREWGYDSPALAKTIYKYVKDANKQKQLGCVSSGDYGMCCAYWLQVKACCIIEHAFMTSEDDVYNKMLSPIAWKNFAEAECKGICEYLGVKYVEEEPVGVDYLVQAGAYSILNNAYEQCVRVFNTGHNCFAFKENGLYKVIVGTKTTKDEAVRLVQYLKDLGISSFVREGDI